MTPLHGQRFALRFPGVAPLLVPCTNALKERVAFSTETQQMPQVTAMWFFAQNSKISTGYRIYGSLTPAR